MDLAFVWEKWREYFEESVVLSGANFSFDKR